MKASLGESNALGIWNCDGMRLVLNELDFEQMLWVFGIVME